MHFYDLLNSLDQFAEINTICEFVSFCVSQSDYKRHMIMQGWPTCSACSSYDCITKDLGGTAYDKEHGLLSYCQKNIDIKIKITEAAL